MRCREGGGSNSTGLAGRSTETWREDRSFCLDAPAAVLEVPPDGPVPRRFPETQKCALAGSQGLVPRPGGPGNVLRCHCMTFWHSVCRFRGGAIGMVGTSSSGSPGGGVAGGSPVGRGGAAEGSPVGSAAGGSLRRAEQQLAGQGSDRRTLPEAEAGYCPRPCSLQMESPDSAQICTSISRS